MREIKFRLWSIHSKKMFGCERNFYLSLEGDLFRSDDLDYINKSSFEVMQYTGLKDKNGKEIYEGDVVELIVPDTPYVIQGNGYSDIDIEKGFKSSGVVRFLYSCWFLDEGEGKGCPLDFDEKQQLEVIGNIYENKKD